MKIITANILLKSGYLAQVACPVIPVMSTPKSTAEQLMDSIQSPISFYSISKGLFEQKDISCVFLSPGEAEA